MHRAGQRCFELLALISWGLPMRAKSSKQRCPALCILDLSYNVKYHWSCMIGGCYGHLTASGSWHGFPGVDHEGRQDFAVLIANANEGGYVCFLVQKSASKLSPKNVAFCIIFRPLSSVATLLVATCPFLQAGSGFQSLLIAESCHKNSKYEKAVPIMR